MWSWQQIIVHSRRASSELELWCRSCNSRIAFTARRRWVRTSSSLRTIVSSWATTGDPSKVSRESAKENLQSSPSQWTLWQNKYHRILFCWAHASYCLNFYHCTVSSWRECAQNLISLHLKTLRCSVMHRFNKLLSEQFSLLKLLSSKNRRLLYHAFFRFMKQIPNKGTVKRKNEETKPFTYHPPRAA